MTASIFTIGHSLHSAERFIGLLQASAIQFVVDVRSVPFSRRAPHFNKSELAELLREAMTRYKHLPEEFGARRYDASLLDSTGKVSFARVRASPAFRGGVQRLKRGAQAGHRIALMCAEEDPLRCHRFSMISYQLVRENTSVVHIRGDGSHVPNDDLEARLLVEYAVHLQKDLFRSDAAPQGNGIDLVYRLVESEIAFNVRGHKNA